jgi:hypothetical protein
LVRSINSISWQQGFALIFGVGVGEFIENKNSRQLARKAGKSDLYEIQHHRSKA